MNTSRRTFFRSLKLILGGIYVAPQILIPKQPDRMIWHGIIPNTLSAWNEENTQLYNKLPHYRVKMQHEIDKKALTMWHKFYGNYLEKWPANMGETKRLVSCY